MSCVALAIFCDDVRLELGNKVTLVGTYSSDMYVAEFPIFIPKLAVSLYILRGLEDSKGPILVRLTRNGDTLMESTTSANAAWAPMRVVQEGQAASIRRSIAMHFPVPPMSVMGPCTLSLTANVEGEELIAGRLHIGLDPRVSTAAKHAAATPPVATKAGVLAVKKLGGKGEGKKASTPKRRKSRDA